MSVGRINFYEERDFRGRQHESSGDVSDIQSFLSRCGSVRVESGSFMLYDRPNFMGNQLLVRRGEYSDIQSMLGRAMGSSQLDTIRSCRMIPMHRGTFRIRLYERDNLSGQMHELMDDCESLQERFRMSDMRSCNVLEGPWLAFEQPDFSGRMMYLQPGEHRRLREVGPSNMMRISSLRRIMEP